MTASSPQTTASTETPAVLLTLGKYRFTFSSLALLITLFSTLLNTAALLFEKVIDDHQLIDSVSQRGCGDNPIECFQKPVFGLYYRPILSASFSLAVRLHGVIAWPHHLANLIFHAIAVGLAFWFFRLLFRRDLPALFVGTLFALHPLQVPATTFIGGRTDSLALIGLMLFGIGAIAAEGKGKGEKGKGGKREEGRGKRENSPQGHRNTEEAEKKGRGRSVWVPILVSVFGFAFAVFTKEQVIPLLLLLPLLTAKEDAGKGMRMWWLLYLLPVGLYLFAANKVVPRNSYEPANWPVALHIEMVGRTLWYYAKALFFPTIPTLHQSTLGHWDMPQLPLALLGFLCAGVWLAALAHLWRNRIHRFFWLWTTLTLVSCLNVIPLPSQPVAPYRAVIPMVGVVGLVGSLWASWYERKGLRPLALFLLLCFLFSCISLADVPYWRNDVLLVGKEVEADPDFLPAQVGLAGVLQERQRYPEAKKQYERVKAILFPGATTVEERIARVASPSLYRFMRGHGALRYKPMELLNIAMRGSGGTNQILGNYADAVADYRVALAAKPEDYMVRDYLAFAYAQLGRYPEAESVVQETLRRAPSIGRRIQLGEIRLRAGRRKEAQETLLEIMMSDNWQTLSPDEKNRVTTLYNEAGQPSR